MLMTDAGTKLCIGQLLFTRLWKRLGRHRLGLAISGHSLSSMRFIQMITVQILASEVKMPTKMSQGRCALACHTSMPCNSKHSTLDLAPKLPLFYWQCPLQCAKRYVSALAASAPCLCLPTELEFPMQEIVLKMQQHSELVQWLLQEALVPVQKFAAGIKAVHPQQPLDVSDLAGL